MKKLTLILFFIYPICLWGQQKDLTSFLEACKTFDFEESKEIVSQHSLDKMTIYDISSYEEPAGISFNADTLDIKGYKAIVNCKIKNKAGQYIDKKMLIVMYLNKESNLWGVTLFRESLDPKKEYNTLKSEVEAGKFYTSKQYVYRNLSNWAINAGLLKEAIKYIQVAEQEAAKANDSKFSIESQKSILNKIL